MKDDDMQILVRHIYSIIENPKKSKKCFNPKKDDIYPDLNNYFFSISDKYKIPDQLNRDSLKQYYSNKNNKLRKPGIEFANNFYNIITSKNIHMPDVFSFDIGANSLKNYGLLLVGLQCILMMMSVLCW